MPFQQPPELPDYSKLTFLLNNSGVASWNPAIYDILKQLIQAVQQSQNVTQGSLATVSRSVVPTNYVLDTKRKWWRLFWNDETSTTSFSSGIYVTVTENGTGSSVVDSITSRRRFTTVAGANNNAAGFCTLLGAAGRFYHLPDVTFNLFTGSAITSCQIWIGLFNTVTPSLINTSGVFVPNHAAFRFAAAADGSSWAISASDGTTQVVRQGIEPIAVSTQYRLRIRYITSTLIAFSVNDGAETKLTLASNANESNRITYFFEVVNAIGGINRFIEMVAVAGDYN